MKISTKEMIERRLHHIEIGISTENVDDNGDPSEPYYYIRMFDYNKINPNGKPWQESHGDVDFDELRTVCNQPEYMENTLDEAMLYPSYGLVFCGDCDGNYIGEI